MADQDEHVTDYYLTEGRSFLAKASNRLMKEAREEGMPYHVAIDRVVEIEEGIKDLSKKIWERAEAVQMERGRQESNRFIDEVMYGEVE